MKRVLLPSLVIALTLTVSSAFAGWRPYTVGSAGGMPTDAQFADAGVVAISTSSITPSAGAFVLAYDDVNANLPKSLVSSSGNSFVGAYYTPSGCLIAVSTDRRIVSSCSAGFFVVASVSGNVKRFRHTSSTGGYLEALNGTVGNYHYSPGFVDGTDNWTAITTTGVTPFQPLGSVSALRVGGNDLGAFGRGSSTVVSSVNGNPLTLLTTSPNSVEELVLYVDDLGVTQVLTAGAGGVFRTPYAGGPVDTVLPDNRVTGVAFTLGTTQGNRTEGDGFGMAIASDGGVYRAVPNPFQPAKDWLPTTLAYPASTPAPVRVMCWLGRSCILLTGVGPPNNVVLYTNAHPPVIDTSAVWQVNEGSSLSTSVVASDADGDPLFVTWSPPSGPVPVNHAASGIEQRQITFTTAPSGALCGHDSLDDTVTIKASDGVSTTTANATLRVVHTAQPSPPGAGPAATLQAGGAPTDLTITAPGTGCAPTEYRWTKRASTAAVTPATAAGPALKLTVTPPATLCLPNGEDVIYDVTAFEQTAGLGVGFTSPPTAVTVHVDPWGAPNVPFADATVSQAADTSKDYFADTGHACVAAPVEVTWDLIGATDPGLHLNTGGRSAQGSPVKLVAPECVQETVQLRATNKVGVFTTQGTLTVNIAPTLTPVTSATLVLQKDLMPGSGKIEITPIVTGLNCTQTRPNLKVALTLLDGQGATVDTKNANPGEKVEFRLTQGACSGQTFSVLGQLSEGATPGPQANTSVATTQTPTAIDSVEVLEPLVARCGEGARGKVAVNLTPSSCKAVTYQWERLEGPALADEPVTGSPAEIRTADADWGELVGQTLRLKVTASGGPAPVERELEAAITSDPFLEVRHRPETPIAAESGIFGVAVTLRNPTACGVTGALYRETLGGLRYVPGSARLNGVPVEPTEIDDVIEFAALDLPSGSERTLTYAARVPMLSTPSPHGQAFLGRGENEVAISPRAGFPEATPAASCGCTGSPSGMSLSALAALALLLRARRRSAR